MTQCHLASRAGFKKVVVQVVMISLLAVSFVSMHLNTFLVSNSQSSTDFQIEDYYKVKQLIAQRVPDSALTLFLEPLHCLTAILLDHMSCRRQQLLGHFDEDNTQEDCGACDYCNFKWNISWLL
jgi:hypothetical protein